MGESEPGSTSSDVVAVSHYRIVQKLRAGGMGEVFLAEDRLLPRVVALKLLPAERSSDDLLRHRFLREAHAASSLSHPNIARIYEAGEDAGRVFIAMEYVDGESLAERIARGALSTHEIVAIALQLVSAAEEAHAQGVIHRDLKPSNVMLTSRGDVKVLDFGLAKFSDAEASDLTGWKSESGLVLGTVPYMSPEQALGTPADARSDIFSIGVLLYELVTGRLPFTAPSAAGTLVRIVNEQPEAMARFNYNLPAELERIIRKCLEKAPERRYQSATDLLVDLRNFDRDRETVRSAHALHRMRRAMVLAPFALALMVVVGIGITWRKTRVETPAVNAEAYRLVLRGRQQWNTRTPAGLRASLDSFRQAIEIEPEFAPAYAGLADTYSLLERYAGVPTAESRNRAMAAAQRAVQLDASLPEGHVSLGSVREAYDWDWAGAEREYRAAIKLSRTYATAHHWLAMLLARLGRFDEAKREIASARYLDPLSPAIAAAVANIDYYAGDYARSADDARAALRLDEGFEQARVQLALALAMNGDAAAGLHELQPAHGSRTAAAAEAMLRARNGDVEAANVFLRAAESPGDAVANGYAIAAVRLALGDREGALHWLRAAVDARSFWVASMAVDPAFASLRDDARFRELLARVGLPGS